jgi:hypothetical protein
MFKKAVLRRTFNSLTTSFPDALHCSDYIESNGRAISETLMREDVKRSDRDLISGIMPEFACRVREKQRKTSDRTEI